MTMFLWLLSPSAGMPWLLVNRLCSIPDFILLFEISVRSDGSYT